MSSTALPLSAAQIYLCYKRNTAIVLEYLSKTAQSLGSRFDDPPKLSIEEMLDAGRLIRTRTVLPPREVYWALRLCIEGRKQMADIYRSTPALSGDSFSDDAHKYYLKQLYKLRRSLFSGRGSVETSYSSSVALHLQQMSLSTGTDDGTAANDSTEWDPVEDEDDLGEEYRTPVSEDNLNSYLRRDADGFNEDLSEGMGIKNDGFEASMEKLLAIQSIVRELGDHSHLTHVWDGHRAGTVSLFEAAFMTDYLYHLKFCHFGLCTPSIGQNLTISEFESAIKEMAGKMTKQTAPDMIADTTLGEDGYGKARKAISRYIAAPNDRSIFARKMVDLKKPFLQQGSSRSSHSKAQNLITGDKAMLEIVGWSQVLEPDVRELLGDLDESTRSLAAVLRLDLKVIAGGSQDAATWLASISTLTWSMNQLQNYATEPSDSTALGATISNPGDARVQALRYAQEVVDSLTALASSIAGYFGSNDYRLRLMEFISKPLKSYIACRRYDLYTQLPWVAGTQLVAFWAHVMVSSVQLLNDEGIFFALLHIHNALVECGMLKQGQLPVLETLSSLTCKIVFNDSRPKFKFTSHYAAMVGGRFQSSKETDRLLRQALAKAKKQGTAVSAFELADIEALRRHMQLPEHMPCLNPECDKHDAKKMLQADKISDAVEFLTTHCLFPRPEIIAKWKGYGDSPAAIRKVVTERFKWVDTGRNVLGFQSYLDDNHIDAVRKMLTAEFEKGKITGSQINWVHVYKLCLDAFAEIGRCAAADIKYTTYGRPVGPHEGLALTGPILGYLENDFKDEVSLCRFAKDALVQIFGAVKCEDIMWKNL